MTTNNGHIHPLPQRTLASAIEAKGVGVHTGATLTMRLEPAPVDSGIVFVRTDLDDQPAIPALLKNVDFDSLRRMTVISIKSDSGEPAQIGMVEHLLAACFGVGLTNLRVLIDGPECPIFDGSAQPYLGLMTRGGIEDQQKPAGVWRLDKPVTLTAQGSEIVALPAERTRLTFFAGFTARGFEDQQVTFEPGIDNFATDIAPARTFCFFEDIEKLRSANLIKGGSLDNAIVLKNGKPINTEYRMKNELARHKLLDLMGDLALLGAPVMAMISARSSGHAMHQEFNRSLVKELRYDRG